MESAGEIKLKPQILDRRLRNGTKNTIITIAGSSSVMSHHHMEEIVIFFLTKSREDFFKAVEKHTGTEVSRHFGPKIDFYSK